MAEPVTTGYHERLGVPWWWWLITPVIIIALAVTPLSSLPPAPAAVGLGGLVVLGWVALWWLGRIRVAVVDGELRVDDARLPLRFVADAIPLDAAGRRELLGPAADPRAFVIQRPWVSGAVQVVLDDPADPTPYWLISSGDPERLAAALTAGRADGRPGVTADPAGVTPAGDADPGRRPPRKATADQDPQ